MPNASDRNWCHKVCDMHAGKSKHFEKPRLSQTSYVIVHFADKVEYQIEGFVEKNRDTVLDEQVRLLKASTVSWHSLLFINGFNKSVMEYIGCKLQGLELSDACRWMLFTTFWQTLIRLF